MSVEQTTHTNDEETVQPSRRRTTELSVTGMTCGNCARHVLEALQQVPGVQSASVSLDSQRASVRWQTEGEQPVDTLIKAVEEAGYGAKAMDARTQDAGQRKLSTWQLNLWIGILGTVPLMIGEWAFGLGAAPWFRWASFAVATVVQVFAGARFYVGAWGQLKAGRSNMDTLVALGSTTAYAYSAWALLSGSGAHLYFMEAAAIITLISVGHWMESRVSVRASSALRQLLNLAPDRARLVQADGTEMEVPVSELQSGAKVALRPGDRVPTDGEVAEGNSTVDESMLTGESTPVEKAGGNPLYAGTVNLNGRLVMRVTATGEETALAHIIGAVQRAQSSRANIQRIGDRVSSVFVPIVVTIAMAAGLWWGLAPASAGAVHQWLGHFLWLGAPPTGALAAGFIIAAAVLIIACPCAMGLATPAAIMAGSNAAAQRGILIRDGVALEKAGNVTAVLFDKTGTLTAGKPEAVRWWAAPGAPATLGASGHKIPAALELGHDGADLLQLASSLARHSTHPVSQAVAKLSPDGIELAGWEEVPGAGVQGQLQLPEAPNAGPGHRAAMLRLGSLRWLRDAQVDLAPGRDFIEEWSAQGATVVGMAAGQSLCGLFAVKDTLKPGAPQVVRQLQRQALKIHLVTGDNPKTAASIAKQAGIDPNNVFAEVRPEQKAEFVAKLQAKGERVAFVGDGINDAPALEQADLGIAVSRASDLAREAADIILLNSEIEAVPESLGLARATLATIKQNLFWAFFYNLIGIPLAALGFMSPVFSAAAMGFSDLVVIGNALRLRNWRLRRSQD